LIERSSAAGRINSGGQLALATLLLIERLPFGFALADDLRAH